MEETAMIENLRPLTQEQRQDARKSARNAVIRALGSKLEFRQSEISLDKKPGKKSTLTTEFRRVNQAFFARVGPRLKTAKR